MGATYPREIGEARRLCPEQILLLPGIGAQGASPANVARAFTSGPASALVSVSRGIGYAYRAGGGDWRAAASAEATRLRGEIWSVSGW
jgi:orotidine-5'-phosphate decarboxylase